MWSMSSFADEYVKIAASVAAAKNHKSRIGKRPIRVHNLLKKAAVPVETAGGLRALLARIRASRITKPAALFGSGIVAGKAGEEYLVEPWQYGRRAQQAGVQM